MRNYAQVSRTLLRTYLPDLSRKRVYRSSRIRDRSANPGRVDVLDWLPRSSPMSKRLIRRLRGVHDNSVRLDEQCNHEHLEEKLLILDQVPLCNELDYILTHHAIN